MTRNLTEVEYRPMPVSPSTVWPLHTLISLAAALRRDAVSLEGAEQTEAINAALLLESVVRGQADQSSPRFAMTMISVLAVACNTYDTPTGQGRGRLPNATEVLCTTAPENLDALPVASRQAAGVEVPDLGDGARLVSPAGSTLTRSGT
ncbi:MAG: hypothetical protein ACTH9H_00800 [Galactobacter sp.]